MSKEKIILALDGINLSAASKLAVKVMDEVHALKIHDLYDQYGRAAISDLEDLEAKIWIDSKLHDIPKTVECRATALFRRGADIITVHASGGIEMMRAALQSGATIYAVTILTSITEQQARGIYGQSLQSAVLTLASQAKYAGVHGIVCSAHELEMLSHESSLNGLEFIVPGVRSDGVSQDDQKRVDTPASAIKNGATRLVIGRQVTTARDPVRALRKLSGEIEGIEQREVVRV